MPLIILARILKDYTSRMATARSRKHFVTTHKLVPAATLKTGLQQTIGFKARGAATGGNVTLSYVKLQTGTYTSTTTASSTNDTSLTPSTGSTRDTSLTTLAEAGKPEATGGSNVGVIVGVIVAVVVVVAAGVVGFFIWKRRKQRGNGNNGQEANLKVSQSIYENTGSSEVQHTTADNSEFVTYRNLYDTMNFETPTEDIHTYKSIDT